MPKCRAKLGLDFPNIYIYHQSKYSTTRIDIKQSILPSNLVRIDRCKNLQKTFHSCFLFTTKKRCDSEISGTRSGTEKVRWKSINAEQ